MFKSFTEKRPTSISPQNYAVEMMDKMNELLTSCGITTVHWKGSPIDSFLKSFFLENLKFSEYDANNFTNWGNSYQKSESVLPYSASPTSSSGYRTVNNAIAFTIDTVKYVIMCNTNNANQDYLNFITLTNVIVPENEMSYMNKYRICSYGYSEYGNGGAKFLPFIETEKPTTYTVLIEPEKQFFAMFCKTKNSPTPLDYQSGFFIGHCGVDNLAAREMEGNIANLSRKCRLTIKVGLNTREEEMGILNPLKEYTVFDTETNIDLNNGKVYLQDCHVYLINYGLMAVLKGLQFTTIQGAKDLEPLSISGHTYYKLPYELYWRSV